MSLTQERPASRTTTHWKRNVIVVWISQFLSIGGFAFSMPFAPFYIQELGVTDPAALNMWVAFFAAATPISIAVASPIWGSLSDRFGHRIMLLRANFAAMVILFMMSRVPSVEWLIVLRFMQGLFTGTLTAAQTMVAADSPTHRSGLALGGLNSAVFGGGMAGCALGGVTAELYGCRESFMLASLLTATAGILVLLGTKSYFEVPERKPRPAAQRLDDALSHLRPIFFILLVITSMAAIRKFDEPFIPLWVQHLHGSIDGSAIRVGGLIAICSIAGLLSGVFFGRLADSMPIPFLGKIVTVGAAICMLAQSLAPNVAFLTAARFGLVFFGGGLDPIIHAWLAKSTSSDRRGLIFGAASSARAIGWAIASLLAGTVVSTTGLQSLFILGAALFLLLIPMIASANRTLSTEINESG